MQKYQDAVLNQNGNIVVGAVVTVTDLNGVSVPVHATDDTNSANINPITTDSNGRFAFYAPDGRYSLVVTFGGNTVANVTDILLEDPLDGSDAVFTNLTVQGNLNVTGTATGLPAETTIPQNSQSSAYTLVLSDAGKHIFHPSADTTARTWTIPANSSVAFPIGTAVTFVNQDAAGVITIAITTDTMRLAGAGTTGNRTLAANGIATAMKVTATEWIISGTGLT